MDKHRFSRIFAPAIIGVAVIAAAGVAFARRRDVHIRCCAEGVASVYTVRGEGGLPLRVLNVGGVYQSATHMGQRWAQPAFAYYRAFDRMFEASRDDRAPLAIRRILMIGGGGCSYPKHVLTTRDDVCVDVVEIDSAIADIAREFFYVDRLERRLEQAGETDRFRLIVDDGLSYLKKSDARYDAIIDDAFSGVHADDGLLSNEGLREMKAHLREAGLFLMNVVADDSLQGALRLQGVAVALRRHFSHVCVVDATDDVHGGASNYLVIASDRAYEFSDVIPW